jgi:hypothetical protein
MSARLHVVRFSVMTSPSPGRGCRGCAFVAWAMTVAMACGSTEPAEGTASSASRTRAVAGTSGAVGGTAGVDAVAGTSGGTAGVDAVAGTSGGAAGLDTAGGSGSAGTGGAAAASDYDSLCRNDAACDSSGGFLCFGAGIGMGACSTTCSSDADCAVHGASSVCLGAMSGNGHCVDMCLDSVQCRRTHVCVMTATESFSHCAPAMQ